MSSPGLSSCSRRCSGVGMESVVSGQKSVVSGQWSDGACGLWVTSTAYCLTQISPCNREHRHVFFCSPWPPLLNSKGSARHGDASMPQIGRRERTRTAPTGETGREGMTLPALRVRYYRRMKPQRVYAFEVGWKKG